MGRSIRSTLSGLFLPSDQRSEFVSVLIFQEGATDLDTPSWKTKKKSGSKLKEM